MLKQFKRPGCVFELVSEKPLEQFRAWQTAACSTDTVLNPTVAALSTASKDGRPSCRMITIKAFDEDGFKMNTNVHSLKGQQLEENPIATLLYFWDSTKTVDGESAGYTRQVRIEGRVVRQSAEDAAATFKTFPRAIQYQFVGYTQSQVIPDMEVVDAEIKKLKDEHGEKGELQPKGWVGYILKPDRYEFWQEFNGSQQLVFDRVLFRRPNAADEVIDPALTHKTDDGWLIERLAAP